MDTWIIYDRFAGAYDLLADAGERSCRDEGLRRLDVRPGECVLEIGCGTGHALAAIGAAVGPNGRVVGVDRSSGMLREARRVLQRVGADHVRLVLSDARAVCLVDEQFDAAFMSFTLELFDVGGRLRVLRELARVLGPGGRLGVVAMAETARTNAAIDVYKWLHRHFPRVVDCRPIPVVPTLERAGFDLLDASWMHIWGLPVVCVTARKRLQPPPRLLAPVSGLL